MIGIAFAKPSQQVVPVNHNSVPTDTNVDDRFRLYLTEVFQMAGVYTPEEAFYLFVKPLMRIAEKQVEAAMESPDSPLSRIAAQMQQVEQDYGLEDGQFWRLEEAPIEYRQLNQQWQRVVEQITAEVLIHFGEKETAELYRKRPEEFRRRMQVGARHLARHGGQWVRNLAEWLS